MAYVKWNEGIIVWLTALYVMGTIYNSSQNLMMLSIVQIFEVLINMTSNNHWLITFFVNIMILIGYSKCKNEKSDFLRIFDQIKYILIIMYTFAFLHKLNYDFIDPEVSCGSLFYQKFTERFTFLPQSIFMEKLTIWSTLVIELCLPICLMIPSTKNIAVIIAFLFHGIIGFNPLSQFWNYSSIIFAILYLYVPDEYSPIILEYMTKRNYIIICISTFLTLGLSYVMKGFEITAGLIWWSIYFFLILKVMISIPAKTNIIKTNINEININEININKININKMKKRNYEWKLTDILLNVVLMLIIFNGLNPYLGFKTEGTFSMFSNLKTELNMTNHMFIPLSWQYFDYQKELNKEIMNPIIKYLLKFKPILDSRMCTR